MHSNRGAPTSGARTQTPPMAVLGEVAAANNQAANEKVRQCTSSVPKVVQDLLSPCSTLLVDGQLLCGMTYPTKNPAKHKNMWWCLGCVQSSQDSFFRPVVVFLESKVRNKRIADAADPAKRRSLDELAVLVFLDFRMTKGMGSGGKRPSSLLISTAGRAIAAEVGKLGLPDAERPKVQAACLQLNTHACMTHGSTPLIATAASATSDEMRLVQLFDDISAAVVEDGWKTRVDDRLGNVEENLAQIQRDVAGLASSQEAGGAPAEVPPSSSGEFATLHEALRVAMEKVAEAQAGEEATKAEAAEAIQFCREQIDRFRSEAKAAQSDAARARAEAEAARKEHVHHAWAEASSRHDFMSAVAESPPQAFPVDDINAIEVDAMVTPSATPPPMTPQRGTCQCESASEAETAASEAEMAASEAEMEAAAALAAAEVALAELEESELVAAIAASLMTHTEECMPGSSVGPSA